MDLRVQRLDPAVEHLGKAGVVGDFSDGQASLGQQLGGPAGREQADAEGRQLAGEVDDAGLVGDRDQGLQGAAVT